jgi:predicted  nucleic acid-binding Zn-ribbon protein
MSEQREAYLGQINFATERMKEADARAADYLQRIDRKSAQIESLNTEIRRLNGEILRMASSYAAESKNMVDRVIQLSEAHAADFQAMHFGTGRESE